MDESMSPLPIPRMNMAAELENVEICEMLTLGARK